MNDGIGVSDGVKVTIDNDLAAAVGDQVAVGKLVTGVDFGVCTVGASVAVLVGRFATGAGSGVCTVGAGVIVLVGEFATGVDVGLCTVGEGVAVLAGAVGVETCESWSLGRSNTDCATARSCDRRVAAALVSAA